MVTVYTRCIQSVSSLHNDTTFRLRTTYTKITTEITFEPVIQYTHNIVMVQKQQETRA